MLNINKHLHRLEASLFTGLCVIANSKNPNNNWLTDWSVANISLDCLMGFCCPKVTWHHIWFTRGSRWDNDRWWYGFSFKVAMIIVCGWHIEDKLVVRFFGSSIRAKSESIPNTIRICKSTGCLFELIWMNIYGSPYIFALTKLSITTYKVRDWSTEGGNWIS